MRKINVDLPEPHSVGQEEFLYTEKSIIAFCGRRWGKTLIFVLRIITKGAEDPGLYVWVGLSWRSASMKWAWKLFKYFARKIWAAAGVTDTKKFVRETEKEVIFPGGLVVWLRSAENPESISGIGPKGIVGDEFPMWGKDVWEEYVSPTTLDHDAWVVLTGSPKGENHASELFDNVLRGDIPGWIARRYTTYDNPLINKSKIDAKRAMTVEWLFRQEYLAEVIEGVGAAISKLSIREATDWGVTVRAPLLNTPYAAGADPSGGGGNEYACSGVHGLQEMLIQDFLLAKIAVKPAETTDEFCKVLKQYNIRRITGDKYAGQWPSERFSENGIFYDLAEKTASDYYELFIPLLTQRKVRLLDDPLLRDQFSELLHKKSSTGRDQILHPGSSNGTHGDRANATAISVVVAHELGYDMNATVRGLSAVLKQSAEANRAANNDSRPFASHDRPKLDFGI